jgi:MATE family multidrug resistance protein
VFVFGFGLDYRCLAFSWVLSTYLSAVVQISLAQQYAAVQRTYLPWDRRAWTEWYDFIALGLPGTVMICSEWWAFEILMIFATILGTAEVAAQTIIQQMSSMSFMVPLGIGITSASFVGNAIGAGRISLAKQMGRTSIAYTACTNLFAGSVIFFFGHHFAEVFTSDPLILVVTERAIPFLSIFVMIDGIQSAASGVLRGAGKQYIGAVANVIAFYGVGLPMAYFLCFRVGYGVNGLLMGIATGSLVQVTVLLVMIFVFEHYLFDTSVIEKDKVSARDESNIALVQRGNKEELYSEFSV